MVHCIGVSVKLIDFGYNSFSIDVAFYNIYAFPEEGSTELNCFYDPFLSSPISISLRFSETIKRVVSRQIVGERLAQTPHISLRIFNYLSLESNPRESKKVIRPPKGIKGVVSAFIAWACGRNKDGRMQFQAVPKTVKLEVRPKPCTTFSIINMSIKRLTKFSKS